MYSWKNFKIRKDYKMAWELFIYKGLGSLNSKSKFEKVSIMEKKENIEHEIEMIFKFARKKGYSSYPRKYPFNSIINDYDGYALTNKDDK